MTTINLQQMCNHYCPKHELCNLDESPCDEPKMMLCPLRHSIYTIEHYRKLANKAIYVPVIGMNVPDAQAIERAFREVSCECGDDVPYTLDDYQERKQ